MYKIKKFVFSFFLLLLFSKHVFSQEATLEKSITAINIPLIGLNVSHEFRLASRLSLKGELGLSYTYSYSGLTGATETLFPYLACQPRWYYNLYKRERKSKKTFGNSANFFGLYGFYQPIISSLLDKEVVSKRILAVRPMWGLRRQLGKKISFEFMIGYQVLGLNFGYNFY